MECTLNFTFTAVHAHSCKHGAYCPLTARGSLVHLPQPEKPASANYQRELPARTTIANYDTSAKYCSGGGDGLVEQNIILDFVVAFII